ncbi:MAG: MBL fold metallo-hydrolase [Treponema sp.]|jgi:phosphoribosyl 1,2-cyclic phosphodiesterase|nr:MBL fold metallo-hydrolase [Treponema sp.]
MFSVRIWGARGSMPCPGPDTVVFGGNTSCLEIRADDRLVIVDLGTGIKPLGDRLMARDFKKGPVRADIFVSHTHWDHIMGLPMFSPLFAPATKLQIYSPASFKDEDSLESVIGNQLSFRYWPVRLSELSARIKYIGLKQTVLNLGGGLRVTTKYLNHPLLCLGYRFEYQGKSIVTAYDTEPFRNIFPTDPRDPDYNEDAAREGELAAREENDSILNFIRNADLLFYDTQYTAREYADHLGWGHSSYESAIDSALKAGVKKLVCFHHDPNRTDTRLAAREKKYQAGLAGKTSLELLMAREGLLLKA